jgi:hypothetical protein
MLRTRPFAARPAVELLEDRRLLTSAQYVTALFTDFLARSPTAAELTADVAALNTGTSPQSLALSILNSDEFLTDQVVADYQALLRRSPSQAEVSFWLGQRHAGLTTRQEEVDFLASDEYFQDQGSTASGWLVGAFRDILGRTPDPGAQATFTTEAQTAAGRAAAAAAIVFSPEADARLVDGAFVRLLDRNADAGGLSFWVGELNAGLPVNNFLASLAATPEYLNLKAGGGLDVTTPITSVPFTLPVTTPVTVSNFVSFPAPTFATTATGFSTLTPFSNMTPGLFNTTTTGFVGLTPFTETFNNGAFSTFPPFFTTTPNLFNTTTTGFVGFTPFTTTFNNGAFSTGFTTFMPGFTTTPGFTTVMGFPFIGTTLI